MTSNRREDFATDTLCIHAGQAPDPAYGAVAPPIFQTSTFAFQSPEQGAARFSGKDGGFVYTRMGNPTIAMLEESVAALEEGTCAAACASGMAAVSTVFFALLSQGDRVVCGDSIYGPSRVVLSRDFARFGVSPVFVDTGDKAQVEAAVTEGTRLLYVESPANPTLRITDLAHAAEIAHRRGALLVVDNTFLSPVLQKPFRFGADIVLHSVTKFLNGHSDVVGGILVFRNEALYRRVKSVLTYLGGTMDPHQAWLVLRGIKTLALRVRAAQESARQVAHFLASHPAVASVAYPGLPGHPQADLIARQMEGPGSLVSFELKGGVEAGKALLKRVKLATLAVSLGGVETLIQHPASMTHAALPPEERRKAGITDGLVRLSVGCEAAEDLLRDLRQALEGL